MLICNLNLGKYYLLAGSWKPKSVTALLHVRLRFLDLFTGSFRAHFALHVQYVDQLQAEVLHRKVCKEDCQIDQNKFIESMFAGKTAVVRAQAASHIYVHFMNMSLRAIAWLFDHATKIPAYHSIVNTISHQSLWCEIVISPW